jgi:hypothetical protein
MEAVMDNLQVTRRGYTFDHLISEKGAKRKIVRFNVHYLAGSQRKGVNVSIRHTTVEQCEGYSMETLELYGGFLSLWAKILPRKNDKQVGIVAEQLDSSVPLIVAAFLEGNGKAALQQAIDEKVTQ